MSYTIEETSEGGLSITTSYYREAELIANIFPRCYSHDTEASYGERIQMVDAIIRRLQEIVREQVAQEIEAETERVMTPTGCICGQEIPEPMDFIAKFRAAAIARGSK
jgi:hypothetical protein